MSDWIALHLHTIRPVCQWIMLGLFVYRFFMVVKFSFYGRKAIEPPLFPGFVAAMIMGIIYLTIYYLGGMFTMIVADPMISV